ncbi:unnamed protein product [Fusarium venenatum]|uniref:Uncharacterized protein n=1 Tax=Fusarium venenatum TaxID=56646 RepID=A0A2L2STG7_9HYPO|nr:uncharacterized protein FVRRES_11416 [Fusarium venenatum]CEI38725.1 unnamed protein product [Fusarium venenatum]
MAQASPTSERIHELDPVSDLILNQGGVAGGKCQENVETLAIAACLLARRVAESGAVSSEHNAEAMLPQMFCVPTAYGGT